MTPAQRPLSPHLQVYRPQITSVLSITHRATGVALTVGSWLLVWWLLAAAAGREAFAAAQWFWGSWIGLLLLFGWSYSLFFHLCNGIRHLVWDAGYGFDLRTTYRSGWTVLIVSLVLTLLAWSIGLALRGAA
jgi:succinate dehydrogenase / fumarate reductase cytochrome b subunit